MFDGRAEDSSRQCDRVSIYILLQNRDLGIFFFKFVSVKSTVELYIMLKATFTNTTHIYNMNIIHSGKVFLIIYENA